MKFKSKQTGAILEPKSDFVLEQLQKSPDYVVYNGPSGRTGAGKGKEKAQDGKGADAAQGGQ